MDTPKKDKKPILLVVVILVLVLIVVMMAAFILTTLNKGNSNVVVSNFSAQTSIQDMVVDYIQPNSETSNLNSSTTSTALGKYIVYMFNSKKFDNGEDPYVVVGRNTSRKDMGAFVLEELIKGPTSIEKDFDLTPTFGKDNHLEFSGSSNCNNKDFILTISSEKVGVVKFCKDTILLGDMSGSIIKSQIAKTLKQFSTIAKVQVLDKNGECFDNMSGNPDTSLCIV